MNRKKLLACNTYIIYIKNICIKLIHEYIYFNRTKKNAQYKDLEIF